MDHEEFESLDVDGQVKAFHDSPLKEKGDLLIRSHQPERLAQSLSHEELYLVTKEMDLEERGEVLKYANLPQLFFIADVECWTKDRMNVKGFVQWLETLQRADERRLLAWLVTMDYEAVVSGLKNVIQIQKPDREYASDELLGDRPYFTLDEQYYIFVDEENLLTIRRAIELLFENHKGRYAAVLEGVFSEPDDVLEEEAYHRREVRMQDRGFPDQETAFQIYHPMTQEEFDRYPKKNIAPPDSEVISPSVTHAPNYPTLWSHERFFLDDVLLLINHEPHAVGESIQEELAWLSNKVLACQGIDFSSEERVRQGIERARRLVSIGLEALSERDLEHARRLLKERWLESIFRWGIKCMDDIRVRVNPIFQNFWKGPHELFFDFLGRPYGEIFRGMVQTIPQCFDLQEMHDPHHLRDFKTLEEIRRVGKGIEQIEIILKMMGKKFPNALTSAQFEMDEFHQSPTLYSLLGNIFVHYVNEKKLLLKKASKVEILKFIETAMEFRGQIKIIRKPTKDGFLDQLHSKSEKDLLMPFWGLVFQGIEEELGRLASPDRLDIRYISSIWVGETKEKAGKIKGWD